jgi:hypothetical protein
MLNELVDSEIAVQWISKFCDQILLSRLFELDTEYNYVSITLVFKILNTLLKKAGEKKQLFIGTKNFIELLTHADSIIAKKLDDQEFEGIGFVKCQARATKFSLIMFANLQLTEEATEEFLRFVGKCMIHKNQQVRINAYKFLSHLAEEKLDHKLFTLFIRPLLSNLTHHVLYKELSNAPNCIRFGLQAIQKIAILFKDLQDLNFNSIGSMNEILNRVIEIHESTQNCYIKEQSIILLGVLVSHLDTGVLSSTMIKTWSELVEMDAFAFQPDNLRYGAQQSIYHSGILQGKIISEKKDQFRIYNVCVRLLQDEEERIRQETSNMLSPLKKLQIDAVLQNTFSLMATKFADCDFYFDFLLGLVALNTDSDDKIVIPFEEELNEQGPALFDKEEDNLFQEELLAIQLAAYHLRMLMKQGHISREKRKQTIQKLLHQLQFIIDLVQNEHRLFWIGDVSHHSGVFLSIYRLCSGICALIDSSSDQSLLTQLKLLVGNFNQINIQDLFLNKEPFWFLHSSVNGQ